MAGDERDTIDLRKKALFWVGQSNYPGPELYALYEKMPNKEMKEQLIFVFSQRNDRAAVDKLFEIARGEPEIICHTLSDLEAFMEEFGYPDFASPLTGVQDSDEWVYQKYKNIPMNELVADEIHAFDHLLSGMRLLSEETLNERGLVRRIKHVTIEHYSHHGADIRKRFKRPLRQI